VEDGEGEGCMSMALRLERDVPYQELALGCLRQLLFRYRGQKK